MKKKKRLNLSLLIDLFFSPSKLDEQIFFFLLSRLSQRDMCKVWEFFHEYRMKILIHGF